MYKIQSSVVSFSPTFKPVKMTGLMVGPDDILRRVEISIHGGQVPGGWDKLLVQEAEQARADRAASPFSNFLRL